MAKVCQDWILQKKKPVTLGEPTHSTSHVLTHSSHDSDEDLLIAPLPVPKSSSSSTEVEMVVCDGALPGEPVVDPPLGGPPANEMPEWVK